MKKEAKTFALTIPPLALASVALALFLRRAWHGLWILPFVDETGHILAARVLASGGVLYRDFVDSHGPLIYALAWASDIGLQPGAARLAMVVAILVTAVAVAASPCLRGMWERLCGLALFVGLVTSLWLVQALCMLDYQPLAGMLLAIGAAQFACPAWCDAAPRRICLIVAGAALGLVPFAAYSYAPTAALLAASGAVRWRHRANRREMLPFGAGAGAALTGIGSWMLLHCDLPGYLAYHFILNQVYFARYIGFALLDIPASLLPALAPMWRAQSLAAVAGALGWLAFAAGTRHERWRGRAGAMLCGAAGMALSNPRGSAGFQDGAFAVLAFAAAAISLARLPRVLGIATGASRRAAWVLAFALAIAAAEAVGRTALSSPDGLTRAALVAEPQFALTQAGGNWMRRLRNAIGPGDPILALPINPTIYFEVGRLPMPGFDHYFPWDADYARHPWFGRGRDICAALRAAPPPVIYSEEQAVWSHFLPRDYMPCVGALLAGAYTRQPPSYFYIRNDRLPVFRAPP